MNDNNINFSSSSGHDSSLIKTKMNYPPEEYKTPSPMHGPIESISKVMAENSERAFK